MFRLISLMIMIFVVLPKGVVHSQQVSLAQEDRERLMKLETILLEDRERLMKLETSLFEFKDFVNRRFDDMNKRFDDVNRRFDDVNRRFDQLTSFLWMIVTIFTTMTISVIGFAYWDRRTTIRKAKEETIEALTKEGKIKDMLDALRMLAQEDQKLARVLKEFKLL